MTNTWPDYWDEWQREVADRFVHDPRELPCDDRHEYTNVYLHMNDGVRGAADTGTAALHAHYRHKANP